MESFQIKLVGYLQHDFAVTKGRFFKYSLRSIFRYITHEIEFRYHTKLNYHITQLKVEHTMMTKKNFNTRNKTSFNWDRQKCHRKKTF